MSDFESPPPSEARIHFAGLLKNTAKLEQMRNPLKTLWNAQLTNEQETKTEQLLTLIDFSQMNNLFENFLVTMGLPVAIIDLKGVVLASSKWQHACMNFHRVNEGTLQRCLESDRTIYAQLESGKNYSSHQCANGLIDCASPIVIEGYHLANLFIGQFFITPPDIDFFKKQQQEFGFNADAYFAAIDQVPIVNEDKLPALMALLVGWAQQIAASSLAEKRAIAALASVENQIKEHTQALAKSHALLQTAQRAARMGHYVTDLCTETWTNDALFDDIFGIDASFSRDFCHWQQMIHPDDVGRVMSYFQENIANHDDFPAIEYRIIRPSDGVTRWLAAWGHNFYDENDNAIQQVGMIQDITERKAVEERVNQLAYYDPLTHLPNRRLLHDRLCQAMINSQHNGVQFAVLLLDLDKFKQVNDKLGHAAGDELLQQVATRIKAHLRAIDLVARLGGDEFVVLIEEVIHCDYVARVAEDIIYTLNQAFMLSQNNQVNIGVSIGISLYPQHGDTVDDLMDNADAALYYAKEQGRGCFAYFSEALIQKARARIALEARLRQAIEQEELSIYFQPQIDIESGQISGAEALLRWFDAENGYRLPNDFIELAEETGLIVVLGEWVLRETCKLGRQWLNQGLPAITLAVNVSTQQFSRGDINSLVTTILDDTQFPAHCLELEITESGLMSNQKQAMAILSQLHQQGVRLAIDDFGTGYSSLAYLKYFPVDLLKIDKTFVDDIPFSQDDMCITATIIALGHHLGFKVLAEGIETAEQLIFLRDQGCDLYQGYLYSKALSANDFAELLAKNAECFNNQ